VSSVNDAAGIEDDVRVPVFFRPKRTNSKGRVSCKSGGSLRSGDGGGQLRISCVGAARISFADEDFVMTLMAGTVYTSRMPSRHEESPIEQDPLCAPPPPQAGLGSAICRTVPRDIDWRAGRFLALKSGRMGDDDQTQCLSRLGHQRVVDVALRYGPVAPSRSLGPRSMLP